MRKTAAKTLGIINGTIDAAGITKEALFDWFRGSKKATPKPKQPDVVGKAKTPKVPSPTPPMQAKRPTPRVPVKKKKSSSYMDYRRQLTSTGKKYDVFGNK